MISHLSIGGKIMNILKKIMNFPKNCIIKYKKSIAKDAKKDMKHTCEALDKFAKEVLDIQITEGSFLEAKTMFLAAEEHYYTVRELCYFAVESMAAFIVAYVLMLVTKEEILLEYAQSGVTFVALFFAAFYFPRRFKLHALKKSKRSKIVEGLTYLQYKKAMGIR